MHCLSNGTVLESNDKSSWKAPFVSVEGLLGESFPVFRRARIDQHTIMQMEDEIFRSFKVVARTKDNLIYFIYHESR